jgi:hypothetical protein
MIAFSTCWNSGRHNDGDEMLREIKGEFGFDLVELGHGIRISLVPGIQKMFDAGEVRFSSLHNFCPLPVEVMAASPASNIFWIPGMSEMRIPWPSSINSNPSSPLISRSIVSPALWRPEFQQVEKAIISLNSGHATDVSSGSGVGAIGRSQTCRPARLKTANAAIP